MDRLQSNIVDLFFRSEQDAFRNANSLSAYISNYEKPKRNIIKDMDMHLDILILCLFVFPDTVIKDNY